MKILHNFSLEIWGRQMSPIVIVELQLELKLQLKLKLKKRRKERDTLGNSKIWNKEKREELEYLLKEGYRVPYIAKMFQLSPATIYRELKYVLTEKEYEGRQFVKYSVERAINKDIETIKGEN